MSPAEPIRLRGVTWGHTRGLLPMVATAQRHRELHPEIHITWEVRSLQDFADFSVPDLAARYDLIVLDHPWMGAVHQEGTLLALDTVLDADFLADQEAHSVGASFESYTYGGHLYGLPTDAATPVAALRRDLFDRHSLDVPETWDDVVELAETGLVGVPGIPIDTLMAFYMRCTTVGAGPFDGLEWVVDDEVAVAALADIAALWAACGERVLSWNPIGLYEAMTNGDQVAYSPFAYGYTNYSRTGYAAHRLDFVDMVTLGDHGTLRSTLGGAGVAISAQTSHVEEACRYATFIAQPETQRGLYTAAGGQPGHRAAWLDEEANRITGDFFANTLAAHDRAFLRPRFPGYIDFQDRAAEIVHHQVVHGGDSTAVVRELRRLAAVALEKGRVE